MLAPVELFPTRENLAALKVLAFLFRIPHMPPAGSSKVLRAPARRGGIRRAPKTKIYNLETGEYGSNPPFFKNLPHFLAGTTDLKKNRKPGIFKIVLNSGTQARKLFQII